MFCPRQFVKLWSAGLPVEEIGRRLRISPVNVRQRTCQLRARGVPLPRRVQLVYTPELLAELKRLCRCA